MMMLQIIRYVKAMIMNALFSEEDRSGKRLTDVSEEKHPRLTLTYFDVPGIAESIRTCLNYCGISFEDLRVTRDEFENMRSRKEFPYDQVPVMTSGATLIAQSKAILRYVGRMGHMHPSTPITAATIDQWLELHTEFMQPLAISMYPGRFGIDVMMNSSTSSLQADFKDRHRSWCRETHLPKYLSYIEAELATTRASQAFVDVSLSDARDPVDAAMTDRQDDVETDSVSDTTDTPCENDVDGSDHVETWLGGMDSMSIADVCWACTLSWLASDGFDGISSSDFDSFPRVREYMYACNSVLSNADGSDAASDYEEDDKKEKKEKKEN